MNILSLCSAKFYKTLYVMLHSLYENNRCGCITLYLLHTDLSGAELDQLSRFAEERGHAVVPLRMNETALQSLPSTAQWPLLLYYRLLAMEVLPASVDRVLSLDADIIVRKPVHALYNADFDGNLVIACPDDGVTDTAGYKQALGLPKAQTYFNAGVMLMDLQRIRERGITIDTFIHAQQGRALSVPDQDLLNIVYGGACKCLPNIHYNCPPDLYVRRAANFCGDAAFGSVIHYLRYDAKPWETYVQGPEGELDALWWQYARGTPFYQELKDTFDKNMLPRLSRQAATLRKYFDAALDWLQLHEDGKKPSDALKARGYRRIALYGLNRMMLLLSEEIQSDPDLTLCYAIDSNARGHSGGVPVRNIHDGYAYDDVDVIVVTAFAYYDEILKQLGGVPCPVISLRNLIFEGMDD